MRILHVVRSDAFYGVERYMATLATAQARMGDEVVVVGGQGDRMRAALAGSGVAFAPGDSQADVLRALWAGLRPADIVHAHMTEAEFAVAAAQRVRLQPTPVVATRHFARHRGASRFGALVSPFIARRLDGQIAISRFVADRIEGDSRIIHPGVPAATQPSADRRPIVLVAQRLEAEKETGLALDAFVASGLAAAGWRLELAGSGAQEAELRARAQERGLADAVAFLGRRDDVPALMARSSLLLATAPAEPFGLTVVEAMAAGLPVVAAAAGGHVESLPAATLRYGFDPGDAAAAGTSLRTLAENPDLRAHLAAVGRDRHATSFTPEAQAAATRTFYEDVLGGTP
ncbi:glycosyltransferase family 4 protein [Propionicicella superfundia]|uniref:glycosyltransferase family 4 protein n=1 Tax=Propionicicella superfundia TaxID=348582 RepID=UPI00056D89E3|nr:glycosyltransferase family 4 protein [Propionicicella superfundia]